MAERDNEGFVLEGEPVKRYRLSCDGEFLGSFDTVTELWEACGKHRDLILPIQRKTNKRARGRYSFRDGRKELRIEELRQMVQQEKKAPL